MPDDQRSKRREYHRIQVDCDEPCSVAAELLHITFDSRRAALAYGWSGGELCAAVREQCVRVCDGSDRGESHAVYLGARSSDVQPDRSNIRRWISEECTHDFDGTVLAGGAHGVTGDDAVSCGDGVICERLFETHSLSATAARLVAS